MKRRHLGRNKRKIADFIWIPIFFILSFAAVKIGIISGDYIYEMDMKIVRSIDAESFKRTLSRSFPIIDAVYNSGNISISLSGEVNSLIKRIFNFELNTPMTILNAQSALFRSYYNNSYLSYIEQKNESGIYAESNNKDTESEHDPLRYEEDAELKEGVSSISIDEDSEQKNLDLSDRISKGMITVFNETDYKIDIDKLLNEPLNLETGRKGPKVLIFHTHTTESYLKSIGELDKKDVSGWNRDERYNVVRVGEELARHLRRDYGIEVIHNGTVHDYPSYNGSYGRSLNTVDKILKSYPSIKIVLDIHRDALGNGDKLRTAAKVDGKDCAKVMFVIGTDSLRLPHPAWNENLKLALKIQSVLNDKYPSLTRHIYISSNRYNQHLAKGALIIEIGGDGDTLDEAVNSTKYLAEAINKVIN